MQDGVREEGMLDELEHTLAEMDRLEKLVLGMWANVSLIWQYIVVMNYQCLSARHVIYIVTCGSRCHLVFCVYVSKWKSYYD